MTTTFAFQLGQLARKHREQTGRDQVEPRGMSPESRAEWERGYGGPGLPPCVTNANVVNTPKLSTAARQPYTPFSTPQSRRRQPNAVQQSARKFGNSPRPANGPPRTGKTSTSVSPKRSPVSSIAAPPKPKVEMGLFGPLEEMSKKTPRTNEPLPLPIPDRERDSELNALLMIGVGQTLAVELIANNRTLDQLVCLAMRSDDETLEPLPSFVRDVLPIVRSYCSSRWPSK